jgi:hypothetical protein
MVSVSLFEFDAVLTPDWGDYITGAGKMKAFRQGRAATTSRLKTGKRRNNLTQF